MEEEKKIAIGTATTIGSYSILQEDGIKREVPCGRAGYSADDGWIEIQS